MAKKGEMEDMEHGAELRLEWNSGLTWKKNNKIMLDNFNKKLYG